MKVLFSVACLMAAIAACVSVQAAEWKPAKRIEVVVPNAPGGGNDRLVRLVLKIAQEQKLIEPVVNVVHKPGAGVVESDEWKKMIERDEITNEFLRSARMREELKSDYDELKAVMTELGLVR